MVTVSQKKSGTDGWSTVLDLYSYQSNVDSSAWKSTNKEFPILWAQAETALRVLKNMKSPGIDNVPAELLSGKSVIDLLRIIICNKIWQMGEWPTAWTQSDNHVTEGRLPATATGQLSERQKYHWANLQPVQRNTYSTSSHCIRCSLTFRRLLIECGMRNFGPVWINTTLGRS